MDGAIHSYLPWKYIFSVIIFLILFDGNFVKGQCGIGEAEISGICFDTSNIARNIEFEVWWVYRTIDEPLTDELENDIHQQLFQAFERIDDIAVGMDDNLQRNFCPAGGNCELLEIDVSEAEGGGILVEVEGEDIFDYLARLNPNTLDPTLDFLKRRYNAGDFDLELQGSHTPSGYNITSAKFCPAGQEKRANERNVELCGGCLPGQYSNDSTDNLCLPCPKGSFQPEGSQDFCQSCPEGQSTEETGLTSNETCQIIIICRAGYFVQNRQCLICNYGRYQPTEGSQDECQSCDSGQITYGRGATSANQCLDECNPGYALSESGDCNICPLGTFLDYPRTERECEPCPNNLTTEGEGSSSVEQCRNIICDAGFIRNGTNPGTCVACPENTFRSTDISLCTSCGDVTRWRTEITGATSRDDCKFYCPGGMFIGENGLCMDCPQDTYKPATEYYSTACSICPIDRPKTLTVRSTSLNDCQYARCSKGQQISSSSSLLCENCGIGYYQMVDEPISETCVQCPSGKSTLEAASDSIEDCKDFCQSGFEKTGSGCAACPVGTYKDNDMNGLFSSCIACPEGFVTGQSASISQSQCTVRNCDVGSFVTSDNTCSKCLRGTYQDERYQSTCKPCPDPESTTAQDGATSVDQCNVYLFRTRIAFKINFDIAWNSVYWDHTSTDFMVLKNRILAHVDNILTGVSAYRQGLTLITMVEGSVSAHMIAKFNKNDPNLMADFVRVLDTAIAMGQISDVTIDNQLPLPVDNRQENVFEYAMKVDGDPDVCPYGFYYSYSEVTCQKCAQGFYQPPDIGDVCLECPADYSTVTIGTYGQVQDVCLLVCREGYEAILDTCQPCAIGYYKVDQSTEGCEACVTGQTTMAIGSTSRDQCIGNVPIW